MEKQKKIEKKLREAERIVTELLTEYPITRDDDRLLVWLFWRKQFERIDNYSLEMFRSAFLGGMLSPPETITRARRKVQEKRPELRGIASRFPRGSRGNILPLLRIRESDTTRFILGEISGYGNRGIDVRPGYRKGGRI
jgi:hypothetical protein